MDPSPETTRRYWDAIASRYQRETRISRADFHFGPLLPGDGELGVLPGRIEGRRCLELGCGAGQNSICLARRGARCTAVDPSAAQLDHGRRLAAAVGVEVTFRQSAMEEFDLAGEEPYDLVHSTYALPFCHDPQRAIDRAAAALRPGGMLVLTVAHPVFAGEWLEIEGEGEGALVRSYFAPPAEEDLLADGTGARAAAYPLDRVHGWLRAAGLDVTRLLEPRPLPIPVMGEQEILARVPYDSPAWRALHSKLAAVPVVAIFAGAKPA